MIRILNPVADASAVLDLHMRAADYSELATGRPPDKNAAAEFFSLAPPEGDPATSLKLGLWEGDTLAGIADVAFGYPEAGDAYVGLLLLAPSSRGRGQGAAFFAYITEAARTRGATRLLIAVLEENTRARVFWERQGFVEERRFPPTAMGARTHARVQMTRAL